MLRISHFLLVALLSVALTGTSQAADDPAPLDWSAWQRLPVFHNGRMMPLDTFARLTVEAVCDRQQPTLTLADGKERKFSAAELLFSWIVEPERWENVPFLWAANEQLRKDWLGVPVTDLPGTRRLAIFGKTVFEGPRGKRLKYVSPRQVQDAKAFWSRLMELSRNGARAGQGGVQNQPAEVEEKARDLSDALAMFRLVTFDPASPAANRSRFRRKLGEAAQTWQALAPDLQAIAGGGLQGDLPGLVQKAGQAMATLFGQNGLASARAPLGELEPPVAALAESSAAMADQFAAHRDRLFDEKTRPVGLSAEQLSGLRGRMHELASQAATLARQANEAHLALYDNGYSLRLVPGLDPAALKNNRDPDDDAQPWISLQTLLVGSDAVLDGYPPKKLAEVRGAFREAADAYRDRDRPDRAATFSAAMARFAGSVRRLAEAIEPARRSLPLEEQDRELVALTAYPPPGATLAEVRYYEFSPFLWSWILGAAAMVFLGLAFGAIRKPMFAIGVLMLAAAEGFTAFGLGMRVYITGWAPVTNMFETVIFVALVVGLLALWFVLYPVFGPGLQAAWRMTAVPGMGRGIRDWGLGIRKERENSSPIPEPQSPIPSSNKAGWFLLVPRLALAATIFAWLTLVSYGSGAEGRTAVSLYPRMAVGSSLPTINDVTVWAVGMGVLVLTVLYVPRALLAFALSVVTVPRTLIQGGVAKPFDKALGRKPFALAGAGVALLAALVAYFAPIAGKNLGPLMPVLRNNFWLTLHVLTITSSYGAGALAWGLGNLALGYYLFGRYRDVPAPQVLPIGSTRREQRGGDEESGREGDAPSTPLSLSPSLPISSSSSRRPPEACRSLGDYTYKATQVTVLLLATGTILGALWADVSWGRFWGWDPKEVWALVSTLVYLAVLHARYTGWIGNFGMALATVLGATSILMSWYGVNLLDSGLHTYGRVTGGKGIIFTAVAVNWAFALLATIRYVLETRGGHGSREVPAGEGTAAGD